MPAKTNAYSLTVWWTLVGAMLLTAAVISTITAGITLVMALLLLPVLLARDSLDAWRERYQQVFAIAFVLLGTAYVVTARQPQDVLLLLNFSPMLLAAPVYVVARRLSGVETIQAVLLLCLAGVVIAIGWGLYEVVVQQHGRASGFLTGSLIYSRAGMLFGFVAGAGSLIGTSRRRYFYLLGPILGIIPSVLGGGRGVLLCAPFLLLLLLVFLLSDRTNRDRWWIAGGVLALSVLGAGVALTTIDISRFAEIPNQIVGVITGHADATDMSTQLRLDFYNAGWTLFTQAPLFGYGWAHLRDAALTILAPDKYGDFLSFHSAFLDFAVAGGVFGIAALILILIAPVAGVLATPRDSLFRARLYAAGVLSLLYFLAGLTDFVLGYDMPTVAYAFMTAIVLGAFREPVSPAGS